MKESKVKERLGNISKEIQTVKGKLIKMNQWDDAVEQRYSKKHIK